MPTDAGIEPRTVVTSELAGRRSSHYRLDLIHIRLDLILTLNQYAQITEQFTISNSLLKRKTNKFFASICQSVFDSHQILNSEGPLSATSAVDHVVSRHPLSSKILLQFGTPSDTTSLYVMEHSFMYFTVSY